MSVEIDIEDGSLVITKHWRTMFSIIFAVAYPLIAMVMVLTCSLLWADKAWYSKLFAVVFMLMTVNAGYTLLAQLLNHTRVEVSEDLLTVVHGPLPWPSGCNIRLDQVKCVSLERRSRHPWNALYAQMLGGESILIFHSTNADDVDLVSDKLSTRIGMPKR